MPGVLWKVTSRERLLSSQTFHPPLLMLGHPRLARVWSFSRIPGLPFPCLPTPWSPSTSTCFFYQPRAAFALSLSSLRSSLCLYPPFGGFLGPGLGATWAWATDILNKSPTIISTFVSIMNTLLGSLMLLLQGFALSNRP